MATAKVYITEWTRNLVSIRALASILSSFGSLFLLVKMTDFFFKNISPQIQRFWWVFFLIGIAVALFMCRPKLITSCKLKRRDVEIEIVVGDLFKQEGALVIGTNTTFDTKISRNLISDKSVQGQFTKKFFGDEAQLDVQIENSLTGLAYDKLPGDREGKNKQYPIGTVAKINIQHMTAFLVSIAHINRHGTASGTFDELKMALANLWVFIGDRGTKGNIVIPVLGSGFSRLVNTREEIVREIIQSFVAACTSKVLCDKLTIVLSSRDITTHNISIDELSKYLRHICTYTEFSSKGQPVGQPAD
ncbi:MAG: hypothetical protein KKC78_01710 [Proteobacteria bacterium]|nr:hypothetical protein [Pseudomonadota bacterium]